jgi:hypothetical protein
LVPDRETRAAAAFVAATAHQLRFSAQRIVGPGVHTTEISGAAIGPELTPTVMFLIADRVADAAQMSRNVRLDGTETVEDHLRRAIVDLALGNLQNIRSNTWSPERDALMDPDSEAINLLWWRLLQGLRLLATDLLGLGDGAVSDGRTGSSAWLS